MIFGIILDVVDGRTSAPAIGISTKPAKFQHLIHNMGFGQYHPSQLMQ
jgi:hypothetical protein